MACARKEAMSQEIRVGTVDGLYSGDGCLNSRDGSRTVELAGSQVESLVAGDSTWWAITDGCQVQKRGPHGVWKQVASVKDLQLNCLLPTGSGLLVGASQAHLLRLRGRELEPLRSFEKVPGRQQWFTPWGGPPDVRSISKDPSGALYVNVHVGGIARSRDDGKSWGPTIDIDSDVHQVLFDPASGLLLAPSADGLAISKDGGDSWRFHRKGLHGSYLRAVAVAGQTILVTASTGPFSEHAAVYRRPLDRSVGLERCRGGLPAKFSQNIDTFYLAASGSCVAFGTEEGSVYLSTDEGENWQQAAEGLPPVRCVAFE